jgi:hypothetical protein
MDTLTIIIFIILIIVLALCIWKFALSGPGAMLAASLVSPSAKEEKKEGASELPFLHRDAGHTPKNVKGGMSSSDLAPQVMDLWRDYTNELGEKDISQYLENYYSLPKNEIKDLKSRASGAKNYLELLISKIADENDIDDPLEFLEKSDITYGSFLPEAKRQFAYGVRPAKEVSTKDLSKIKLELDKFLRRLDARLSESQLDTQGRDFLKFNKLVKLRDSLAKQTAAKIKKEIKLSPARAYEADLVGMLPRLKHFAQVVSEHYKSGKTLDQVKKYLEDLGILKRYSISLSDAWTLADLAEKLRAARENSKLVGLDSLLEEELRRQRRNKELYDNADRLERERRERSERERLERERREREEQQRRGQRREREEKEADDRERQMEVAFYEKLKQDPELENVAAAMGMTIHDLFEQYKVEQGMAGGDDDLGDGRPVVINEEILQKIKKKLKEELDEYSMDFGSDD